MILLPDSPATSHAGDQANDQFSSRASAGITPCAEDLVSPANASAAWARVRRNRGCAGVDGVTIAELEPCFEQTWRAISATLLDGSYRPQPLLRARIPKPAGGLRLLAIPAVTDRVVQQAAAQVFATYWEPRFSSHSFAYRPRRGPHDALAALEHEANLGAEWVLHLDIENFFDSVPHAIALSALRNELGDPRLAALVSRTLTCGVFENGLVRPSEIGLAQGSPLSPLLANIVLHRLDARLESGGAQFVRYADDCCVLHADKKLGLGIKQLVTDCLADLGLRLNEHKTAFGHFSSARFLGFSFQRNSRGKVVRLASPESLADAEATFTRLVQSAGGSSEDVAAQAAQMLRSWLAYFYTSEDEARLKALWGKVLAAWQARFPRLPIPDCLAWNTLLAGRVAGDHMDYSGTLREDSPSFSSVDWSQTMQCLLLKLLRSRWWGIEYDLGLGQRPPALRLRLGGHRINLRF